MAGAARAAKRALARACCAPAINADPDALAEPQRDRVEQFRYQVERRLSGELTEDEFKPLRLMNGLYLQLHAYMLRIAIPYGTLSSGQLRMLAQVARVRAEVAGLDRQQSTVRHRLARVHGEVEQDLMQLAGVRIDRPEILLALDVTAVQLP